MPYLSPPIAYSGAQQQIATYLFSLRREEAQRYIHYGECKFPFVHMIHTSLPYLDVVVGILSLASLSNHGSLKTNSQHIK